MFYKRLLLSHNFVTADLTNAEIHYFLWDVTNGNRGAHEIATGIPNLCLMAVEKGVMEVDLFCDNYGSQSRNKLQL